MVISGLVNVSKLRFFLFGSLSKRATEAKGEKEWTMNDTNLLVIQQAEASKSVAGARRSSISITAAVAASGTVFGFDSQ